MWSHDAGANNFRIASCQWEQTDVSILWDSERPEWQSLLLYSLPMWFQTNRLLFWVSIFLICKTGIIVFTGRVAIRIRANRLKKNKTKKTLLQYWITSKCSITSPSLLFCVTYTLSTIHASITRWRRYLHISNTYELPKWAWDKLPCFAKN